MEELSRLTAEMRRNTTASAQDFTDVFGGPPRTIISHQLSVTGFFYDDIFWQSEKAPPPLLRPSGRNLPLFNIPPPKQTSSGRHRSNGGFFSDIFGEKKAFSSRSRSKTNSSSALSSEELSPLRRPAVSDDGYDDVSLLASKLRPINVKNRLNSVKNGHEDHKKQQKLPSFPDINPNLGSENEFLDKLWSCPFRRNAIAESVNLEHMNLRVSENDVQFNSPSSAVSSDRNIETCEIIDDEMGQDFDEDEDELMSSYVIEIDSCNRETTIESNDVDEAIAWAKEKFQKYCSQEKPTQESIKEHPPPSKGPAPLVIQDEMSILDEKIRLWLIGKEADVRLLLSSLHNILWPSSGWIAIPLMNLIESSQVKKAYQKAVLCLHPDKLQQRGATPVHKHIAEKVFAALQDAWTAFISLDVSCR